MFQPLKKQEGFTLIEMIIAVAILGIFFTTLAVMLPQWTLIYHRIIDSSYARTTSNSIADAITDQLAFATGIQVSETDGRDTVTYTGGQISPQTEADGTHWYQIDGYVYDKRFYMNQNVDLDFQLGTANNSTEPNKKRNLCTLTITISRKSDGAEIYSLVRNFPLYNYTSSTSY